jgi:hypothetical protein
MNKTFLSWAFAGIFVLTISCKKKSDPEPTPDPPPAPPAHVNTFTAEVNGKPWSAGTVPPVGTLIYDGSVGGTPKRWSISGSAVLEIKNRFYLDFPYAIGTVGLGFGNPGYANYTDTAGKDYLAATGTINITMLDTSHGQYNKFNKLKATFSMVTQTVSGKSYTITNGYIDYEYKGP